MVCGSRPGSTTGEAGVGKQMQTLPYDVENVSESAGGHGSTEDDQASVSRYFTLACLLSTQMDEGPDRPCG